MVWVVGIERIITGVLLVHELQGLFLVAESLAVVVVASSQVVTERLLVEFGIQRRCRPGGLSSSGSGASEGDGGFGSESRSELGRGNQKVREATELNRQQRHRRRIGVINLGTRS